MEDYRFEDNGDASPEDEAHLVDEPDQGTPDEPEGTSYDEVPKKMGFGEKVLTIFVEPSNVFKNIFYHNDWLTPLVVGGALSIISGLLVIDYNRDLQAQFRGLLGVETAQAGGGVMSYVGVVFVPLGIMFGWLIAAAILFLIGTFTLEKVDFKKLYAIIAFASFPSFLTGLVNAVYRMGQTPNIQSYEDFIDASMPWTISLGTFLNVEGPLGRILSTYDIFAFWGIWLLFLGLVYGLGNSKGRVVLPLVIYVAVGVLVLFGMFLLQSTLRPPGL